ncbi:MAG: DUF1634 domain-containing protein [Elusimicrobia bacterium]|nr:DUF1634 domain-containing protein [Elusimicrobiota bacterium]
MGFDVYDASAWILRGGVLASIATMLVGLAESFREGIVSVELMQTRRFNPDLGAILRGAIRFDGMSLVELGILILVLTPILRVATALALFARERDRLYTVIASIVLALSLGSLLLAR